MDAYLMEKHCPIHPVKVKNIWPPIAFLYKTFSLQTVQLFTERGIHSKQQVPKSTHIHMCATCPANLTIISSP